MSSEIVKVEDPFEIPVDAKVVPAKIKRALAFNLRKVGIPYAEISERLGITIGTAKNYVSAFISDNASPKDVAEVVDLELLRLDELQAVAWQTAKQGDLKAMDTILKIMSHRAKLLGVGVSDKSGEASSVTTNNVLIIGGNEDEYIQSLQKAQEAQKQLGG